jgi:hypothetical protein
MFRALLGLLNLIVEFQLVVYHNRRDADKKQIIFTTREQLKDLDTHLGEEPDNSR